MKTILIIETSSPHFSAAIFDNGEIVCEITPRAYEKNAIDLVETCLGEANISIAALSAVAVDIGPGNLSSVRAGLALAKGLALAAKIPVIPVNSLEAIAAAARRRCDAPVLCARKAGQGRIFFALARQGVVEDIRLAPIGETAALVEDLPAFGVAGSLNEELARLFQGKRVLKTGVEFPRAAFFGDLRLPDRNAVDIERKPIIPVTDLMESPDGRSGADR